MLNFVAVFFVAFNIINLCANGSAGGGHSPRLTGAGGHRWALAPEAGALDQPPSVWAMMACKVDPRVPEGSWMFICLLV